MGRLKLGEHVGIDRFDVVLGHYLWCSENHEGQGDWVYERLSRITRYFRPPRIYHADLEEYAPGAAEVYRQLNLRYQQNNGECKLPMEQEDE